MSRVNAMCCAVMFAFSSLLWSQAQQTTQPNSTTPPAPGAPTSEAETAAQAGQDSAKTPVASQSQVDSLQTQFDKLKSDLQKQQDSDFAMTLGIGSLIVNSDVTDYSNQSNVLQANNLGSSSPQYLVGVSMRTRVPNFRHLGAHEEECTGASATVPKCDLWRRRPWEAFISLKFSPQSSQTLNGFVLGGSYAFAHYLDAMIGYALTPINEPAPGFRVAASNFVIQQQKNGADMNFNPTAMRNNSRDAFDGFPLTDSNGKLIYNGNPLEVHYRGGAVFGVSLPINFGALFSSKNP